MTEILPFDNAKKNHGLHVENLGKKYRKKRIISDISLTLFKGEVVALLGPNGAGKSTLMKLLLGHDEMDEGSIWTSPGAEIAYLPQEVFLIDDTIENNIALGDKEVNREKMNKALESAKVNEFIYSLPKGINTIVGDKGVKISGGQKQRIALARAFYFERNLFENQSLLTVYLQLRK